MPTARVREGAPIGRSLAVSRLFPPMTIHLISSGESSGELDSMLERAAISQERELDGLLAAMVGLLGPLLIVLMGGVRHDDRVCDAPADLRDEQPHPLAAAGDGMPAQDRAPFTKPPGEIAVAAPNDLISRRPIPAQDLRGS